MSESEVAFGFQRLKYRDPPLKPTLKGAKIAPASSMSTYKKVPEKKKEAVKLDGYEKFDQAPFYPGLTQTTLVSSHVVSDETALRNVTTPSLHIRLKEHEGHMRRKDRERRLNEIMETNRGKWEELLNNPVSTLDILHSSYCYRSTFNIDDGIGNEEGSSCI